MSFCEKSCVSGLVLMSSVPLESNAQANPELADQIEALSLEGELKLHIVAGLESSRRSPDLTVLDTESVGHSVC
jgi:hypothetical protein